MRDAADCAAALFVAAQPLDERVDPAPLKNRMRRNSQSDHDEDKAVPSRRAADHPLVLFLDILDHDRVDASPQEPRPNTSKTMLTALTAFASARRFPFVSYFCGSVQPAGKPFGPEAGHYPLLEPRSRAASERNRSR